MLVFVLYWVCYCRPDKYYYMRDIVLGPINDFVAKREGYIAVNIPTLDMHGRRIKSHGSVNKVLDKSNIKAKQIDRSHNMLSMLLVNKDIPNGFRWSHVISVTSGRVVNIRISLSLKRIYCIYIVRLLNDN